jgi:ABC-type lipoprotein release transport system permease subunit
LIISLIAFVGISLSVSAVLLTMGAFSGFQKALKEKILATTPHIIVSLFNDDFVSKGRRAQKTGRDKKDRIRGPIQWSDFKGGEGACGQC